MPSKAKGATARKQATRQVEILELLHQDHEEAKTLLKQLVEAESADPKQKRTDFDEFRVKFLAHSLAEARAFYGPLKKSGEDDALSTILQAEVEHIGAERLIQDLSGSLLELEPERWRATAKVLLEQIKHHIEEEEDEIFELAEDTFEEPALAAMGNDFLEEKRKMMEKLI